MTTDIIDQPPPIPQPDKVPVWRLVIQDATLSWGSVPEIESLKGSVIMDMAERDKIGRQRYGTPLTTHNGRDHLIDAYQESLDLAVYLRAHLAENNALAFSANPIALAYQETLRTILTIKASIVTRKAP